MKALAYVASTSVEGIGCDTGMPVEFMADVLASHALVQGNLDPLLLVAGGSAMERRVGHVLETLRGRRFVFNLGHSIVPETPPENILRLVELVRASAP